MDIGLFVLLFSHSCIISICYPNCFSSYAILFAHSSVGLEHPPSRILRPAISWTLSLGLLDLVHSLPVFIVIAIVKGWQDGIRWNLTRWATHWGWRCLVDLGFLVSMAWTTSSSSALLWASFWEPRFTIPPKVSVNVVSSPHPLPDALSLFVIFGGKFALHSTAEQGHKHIVGILLY